MPLLRHRHLVTAIRDLHRPDPDEVLTWLYCDGCDFGGWEGERPRWPCRTAELVYTPEELAEIQQAAEDWDRWHHQMRWRNPSLGPHTGIFGFLSDAFLSDKVFPKVSFEASKVEFKTNPVMLPISRQFLED